MLKTFSGRPASQHPAEIAQLIELFQREGVRSYCEIGARDGDTFHHVLMSLPDAPTLRGLAVDMPGATWGRRGTDSRLQLAVQDLRRAGVQASMLLGDSTEQDTVRKVVAASPFEALLIDGDHRYAGVIADWLNYASTARLVCFHDIAGTGQMCKASGAPVEVPRFWEELKTCNHRWAEFIAPGSTMGIGVIWTR